MDRYQAFYEALSARGLVVINDALAYKMCPWLPESYHLVEDHTPASKWIPAAELIRRGEVDWEKDGGLGQRLARDVE